jgi:hypothetical protein
MKAIQLFGISAVVVAMSASSAFAKVTDESNARGSSAAVSPLPKASTLADNVVVAPSGQTSPAPAPQPAPAQVNVQPAPQPVEAAPTYVQPRKTVVTQDEHHNYMATIAVSALLGGVAGALIGGAIYYLDNQDHPYNIGYWAAGGVLVGTGVGLINIMADESRAERAVSTRFEKDPVPTYRLSLLKTTF